MHSWNTRDQPEKELIKISEETYRKIEKNYNLLKKVAEEEDAHKIVRQIWSYKRLATEIELEIMRRSWNNDTSI